MADQTKFLTFDRIVNIHQSVKLAQLTELNKAMLYVQLQSNQKLNALNKELRVANHLNKQILENQINQIQREEEQRFYKSLVFNCIEIIDKIEAIKDKTLQAYFVDIYKVKLKSNLENGKDILDELSDKTETKKHLERISNLIETNAPIFSNSVFAKLYDLIADYKTLENSHNKLLSELDLKINLIVIPREGIFGLNKNAAESARNLVNVEREKYNTLLQQKNAALEEHNLTDFINQVRLSFPNFDQLTNDIVEIENKFKNKFKTEPVVLEKDPLFWEVAKYVVSKQECHNRQISSRFKLGYSDAESVIEKLQEEGIIGNFQRNIGNPVLIRNLTELEEYFIRKNNNTN